MKKTKLFLFNYAGVLNVTKNQIVP